MSIHKPIDPLHFVQKMEHHWTDRLKNIPNNPLRNSWEQMAQTFNAHITADHKDSHCWSILQPPTGSGKTQGTILYCSLLSAFKDIEHPGVLIVQKLIDDCDETARQINKYGDRETAFAYHSKTKDSIKLAELRQYPVLVVTHRAYELALDQLGQDGTIQLTWPFFNDWNVTGRKLIAIDECIDVVEHSQAGLDGLRNTLGVIPQDIRKRFPTEITAIEAVITLLDQMDRKQVDAKARERMINKQQFLESIITNGTTPNFTALRSALRKEGKFDVVNLHSKDPKVRDRMARVHDKRLSSLSHIFQSWVYFHPFTKQEGKNTLNTARLLIPDGVKGAVILDATASVNPLYTEKVFKRASLIPAPKGTRNYKNVTLYVSKPHFCGQNKMVNNAKDVCSDLITELERYITGVDRKVFIATHKALEPMLNTYSTSFEMDTGHYGVINGSNRWQGCDTAVIFGLPYLPDTWSPNIFMAHRGEQTTEWLNDENSRKFNRAKDIRKALKYGQMTVDVVQAINRVRCRKTIDRHGNCPRTTVYLMLPAGEVGEAILKGIKQEMPGVKVRGWDYRSQKRKPKRRQLRRGLILYLEAMDEGRVSRSQIIHDLGLNPRQMSRFIQTLDDPESEFTLALARSGVKYEIIRFGKSYVGYFIKSK